MLAVQPTGQVSPNDALSYAMTAQYWAGYWMGVAQAKSQPAPLRDDPLSATQIVPPTTSASNVFVTRQQFHSNSANGLRR